MDITPILNKYPQEQDYLIEILQDIDSKSRYHYVSENNLKIVATYLGIPISRVYSVMSFYSLLSTKKRGRYIIRVCKDLPCYVSDDFNVLSTLEDLLQIQVGETTKDELFTLEQTACIGCCEQAPVMSINHEVFGNLTKEKISSIIDEKRRIYHD